MATSLKENNQEIKPKTHHAKGGDFFFYESCWSRPKRMNLCQQHRSSSSTRRRSNIQTVWMATGPVSLSPSQPKKARTKPLQRSSFYSCGASLSAIGLGLPFPVANGPGPATPRSPPPAAITVLAGGGGARPHQDKRKLLSSSLPPFKSPGACLPASISSASRSGARGPPGEISPPPPRCRTRLRTPKSNPKP